jgi:hypothetical protein
MGNDIIPLLTYRKDLYRGINRWWRRNRKSNDGLVAIKSVCIISKSTFLHLGKGHCYLPVGQTPNTRVSLPHTWYPPDLSTSLTGSVCLRSLISIRSHSLLVRLSSLISCWFIPVALNKVCMFSLSDPAISSQHRIHSLLLEIWTGLGAGGFCNPRYLGDWDWEDHGLKSAWANSLQNIFKITRTKYTGDVAQLVWCMLCKCEALSSNPSSPPKNSRKILLFPCSKLPAWTHSPRPFRMH